MVTLLLLVVTPVWAQRATVRGIVKDSTSAPLAGVSVLVKGTVLGTVTSLDGSYIIRNAPAGDQRLVFAIVGYGRREIAVSLADDAVRTVDVTLAESAIQSGEVVVTAGRRPQSLDEVPVSIAVVDGADIERRSQISLDQALRYIPGVNMTESQVNIRGSSGYSRAFGTRVLILVDGIPQLSGDAGEIKYDAVPMFSIDRIEVVKGAGSALYGSSALGGVINVITRDPAQRETRARVSAGVYDAPYYSEWKWWGSAPRAFGGVDLQHADRVSDASYIVTGGWHRNEGYRRNDDFVRWNFNGKTKYRLAGQAELGLFANYAYEKRGNWIYWRGLDSALIPPRNTDLTEKIVSTKFQVGGQWRKTFGPEFSCIARGYAYRTAYDTRSDTADYALHPSDRTQSAATAWGMELQGIWVPHATDMLTFGLDGTYGTVNSLTYGDKFGWSGAWYVQNEWSPLANLTLSTGARFDLTKVDTTAVDGQVNPRAGIAYTPMEGTTLRASAGRGFRSPSIAERYVQASGGAFTTKPNPTLRAESSVSYEVGINQGLPVVGMLDVAAFWSDYDNLVEPTLDPADGKILFENLTRARITGIEIGLTGSLLHGMIDYSVGYTLMDPRDPRTDSVLKYRPRHLLYATGQMHYAGFTLAADFRYISRVDAIDDAAGLFIRNADIRVATYVTDMRLMYDFSRVWIPVTAILAVNNLFQYNYSEIIGNLAPIRHFMLTVEARY